MKRNPIETIMGAVVILVALYFLVFAYSQADLGTVKGYTVQASFASVGGLANGSDVSINGIKVGTVLDQSIDPKSYDAVVKMSIAPNIHLPDDTVAAIDSDGLLGSKYVKLMPGHATAMVAAGGTLGQTKTYESLEDMVGQFIFLATSKPGDGSSPPSSPSAPAGASPQAAPSSAAPDLPPGLTTPGGPAKSP